MNRTTENIVRFIVLLALQVLIFNHIHLFGFINPNVYLLALFLLPLDIPRSAQYAIAFAAGFVVDLFQFTYGIHASACMCFILLRPYLMYALNVNKNPDLTHKKPPFCLFPHVFFLVRILYPGVVKAVHALEKHLLQLAYVLEADLALVELPVV